MKRYLNVCYALVLTVILCSVSTTPCLGQNFKYRGFSYYKPYDHSFTSPESRHKNGVSLGLKTAFFTNPILPYRFEDVANEYLSPADNSTISGTTNYFRPVVGATFGFHYMFLKKKKLNFYDKYRTEFNAFNIYFVPYFAIAEPERIGEIFDFRGDNITHNNKTYINSFNIFKLTYTSPSLSYRGKLFNFYILNEIGLSVTLINAKYKSIYANPLERSFKTFLVFDPLRVKLGKGKMFFTSTMHMALDSTPLQPNKIESSFNAGFQIYLFKEE